MQWYYLDCSSHLTVSSITFVERMLWVDPRVRLGTGHGGSFNRGVAVGISAPQIFKDVTPERYEILADRGRRAGIPLSGNSGSASMFGVEVCWSYSPETQELTVQCLRAPFFMNQGEIDARIRNMVEQTAMA
jgi:hypothetical protein